MEKLVKYLNWTQMKKELGLEAFTKLLVELWERERDPELMEQLKDYLINPTKAVTQPHSHALPATANPKITRERHPIAASLKPILKPGQSPRDVVQICYKCNPPKKIKGMGPFAIHERNHK